MTHRIFISSYRRDFQFLRPCLYSITRFCRGFLPPVIAVPAQDVQLAREICAQVCPDAIVAEQFKGPGSGMVRAMLSMLRADLYSEADCHWLVGSDCLITREMTPEAFCLDGKPIMLYNRFSDIGPSVEPWRLSTNRILGIECEFETMRRLPVIYPAAVLAGLRAYLSDKHKMPAEQFLGSFPGHCPWSESNLLGSYAKRFMPDPYTWMHCVPEDPAYVAYTSVDSGQLVQLWSHGGLDRPTDAINQMNGRSVHGMTPRQIIREVLGSDFI